MKPGEKKPKDPADEASARASAGERQDKVEGEGSYTATQDYNERTREFVEAGAVEEAARDAEPDSASEAAELREAEEAGKARAKK